MERNQNKLNDVLRITHELFQIQDLDILLEEVLSKVRALVHADAGSIYLLEDNQLKFSYTQNDTLQKKLGPNKKIIYATFTLPINNRSIAGYAVNTATIINIANAYKIDGKKPYKFDRHFDKISGYHTQSILTIPIRTTRGKTVGVIQLINAKNPKNKIISFSREHELLVQYFADNIALVIERAQTTRAMIMRMIALAALRDPKETSQHANRVAAYSVEIYGAWLRKHNISEKEITYKYDALKIAALLHDIGKVAIPDAILKKHGPLTKKEKKVMQEHAWRGANLFINPNSEFDEAASCVALNHHEKWDGTGYPGYINIKDGTTLPSHKNKPNKKGNEIPLLGQIVAIADVYDALNSERCYKKPFEEEKVLKIIKSESGKHFNPEIVDSFFNCLEALHAIATRYPEKN